MSLRVIIGVYDKLSAYFTCGTPVSNQSGIKTIINITYELAGPLHMMENGFVCTRKERVKQNSGAVESVLTRQKSGKNTFYSCVRWGSTYSDFFLVGNGGNVYMDNLSVQLHK